MKPIMKALFIFALLAVFCIIAGSVSLSGELLKLACMVGMLAGIMSAALVERPRTL